MGIFSGLFKSRDKPENRTAGSAYTFYMGGTTAGKTVTERSAMQMTAVYSCVRILAEAVAGLPLHLYKYTDGGGKEKALNHPLYRLLHDEPNPEMSSFVFRETLMTHLLLWGNAYAQVIRNGKGEVIALYPLMPNKMSVDRDENGRLYYTYYRGSDEAIKNKDFAVTLQPSDVLHIPGLGFDGLVGYSPIAMAKNAIGMAIACEEYGAKFFANGAAPGGVLEHPGTIKDPQRVRESWQSTFGGSGNANNGYSSKAFDKFIAHRSVIAQRLADTYSGTVYPSSGFMAGHALAGKPYDPAVGGGVSLNSMEVLVPAFLAAYTGKDPNKVGLSAFPSIKSLLPNWRVTYDGLIRIPVIRKYFKSMMLSHQYRCSYSVGAFSSFLDWVDAGQDGLGYIRDIQTGNPTPSSPYDIAAVSITEGFSPLFGVDATLLNNITGKFELRKTRNLSLNISSYQLVEALSNEFVIGVGYKLTEFNKVLKMKKTRDFSNDLTIRLDFSYRKMQSLIRKIEDQFTQATSGNIAKTIQFSADYGLSRALTLRAFYDLQINEPIVSTSSYPTSNSNYGISLRFSLAQ